MRRLGRTGTQLASPNYVYIVHPALDLVALDEGQTITNVLIKTGFAMFPSLERIDHIHVFVMDRAVSERWYADVLDFTRVPKLEHWARGGGPLTLANPSDTIHLALFERPSDWTEPSRATIAMAASGGEFLAWRRHLSAALGQSIDAVDHGVSWSMYFSDPDKNPFEITSYEYDEVAAGIKEEPAR